MHLLHREIDHRLLRPLLFVCIHGLILCISIYGLDRDRAIFQFHHTAWTAKDGAPGRIKALAQTSDGFLWLGTAEGLYRFDGLLFERYEPRSGGPLPSINIYALLALPDGGLWIGYWYGGVSYLKDGHLTSFGEREGLPEGRVRSFAKDEEGSIWAAIDGGLARLEGSRWRRIGKEWNYPGQVAQAVFIDHRGTLWVATEGTIVFLPKRTNSFQATNEQVHIVIQIGQSPDGAIWIAETSRSVRQIQSPGIDPRSLGPEVCVGSMGFLFDREGALWVTSMGDGIRRAPFPDRFRGRKILQFSNDAEIYTEKNGLTADYLYTAFEDREGDIWIGSANGLDRFRENHMISVRFPPGYSDFGLAPGDGGDVYTVSLNQGANRIRGDVPTKIGPIGGMTAVFRDQEGAIWMGGGPRIFRFRGDQYTSIKTPVGSRIFGASALFKDREGALWIYLDQEGAFRFKEGVWARYPRQSELPKGSPITGSIDSLDRIWFGYARNVLTLIDGDRIRTFSRDDGLEVGDVKAIHDRSQRVWVGGTLGLAVFEAGRFRMMFAEGAEAFTGVSGIVETADGSVWLNANRGVVHIPAEEARLALEKPAHRIRYRLFDFMDGLLGTAQQHRPFPTAIEGSDGRLWFATNKGVVWIKPSGVLKNMVPPPVLIRSLNVETKKYQSADSLLLPPGTANLWIEYTALSLSTPERARFRYKLDGIDEHWQDGGDRRKAFYNSLRPGAYTFRVTAANQDGVWNEEGATLDFRIAPSWYQTNGFLLLCFVAGFLIVLTLFRLRVRQIEKTVSAQFDERLAERTRMARELHDTFLQTVQGSKMVADDALEHSGDPIRMRRALEKLSDWLGQATQEGRAALNSLRTSTTQMNDLAEAFQRATETCLNQGSPAATFSVAGEPRDMHPIVRDEIYRIGYEAIRNACAHSGASRLEVELRYEYDLVVRVKDDGKGIDETIAAHGKDGHFGLQGMRERAFRIGAEFTLASSATAGTEITLVVPGGIAFRTGSHLE